MNLTSPTPTFDAVFDARARCVRFVLVAPSHPGNIGSAARAIRTMGFTRLSVVNPRTPGYATDPEALAFATQSVEVLQSASTHSDLRAALKGVGRAYAMTGYAREYGSALIDLRVAAEQTANFLAQVPDAEVAYVFGTERSGLTNEEVELCTDCCAIAADPRCASLNVAQAVQVTAYEVQRALRAGLGHEGVDPTLDSFEALVPATVDQVDRMFDHLEQALIALGYLNPDEPKRLMSRLRRLLGRARPTDSEIDILRGIAAAMIERKSDRLGKKTASIPIK